MKRPGLALLVALLGGAAAAATPSYEIVDRIPGPDGAFDYASFNPELKRVYVGREDGVTAIDVETRRVIPKLTPGEGVHANVVLPGGRRVVSTHGDGGAIITFDAETGKVLATAKAGNHPDAAVFDPVSGYVWVANYLGGDATLIDPQTGAAAGTVLLGLRPESPVVDGKGRLFVNSSGEGVAHVRVLDTRARKQVAAYEMAGCNKASGLAYVARFDLLISICRNGQAWALRAADGRVVQRLAIGEEADGVLYDAARQLVLVPSGDAGELQLLAIEAIDRVIDAGVVKTQVGSATGALDPATGRVYLPAAVFDPAPDQDLDPVPRAGTFELIVLAPR